MKYVDEFRDPKLIRKQLALLEAQVKQPWTIMEICGGQTHAIARFGLDELLPEQITLVHGPGCPVCVTPLEIIDQALAVAALPHVIFCSFGDMARVPGSHTDLLSVKADGADVRLVYSPLDAVNLAAENPDKEVVFFAVGFETTAPAAAMAVETAKQKGLHNFSLLVSHVLVPPAMEAILSDPDNLVQGFLAAGHVCTVTGYQDYYPIAAEYRCPIVVTGFEPLDILRGITQCVQHLEAGKAEVTCQYSRSVRPEGNPTARALLNRVFTTIDRKWRGIGTIPQSGWGLSDAYIDFDAAVRFDVGRLKVEEPSACISGQILRGRRKPNQCPEFGKTCTPDHPLGATMVSSEGACAAYWLYKRPLHTAEVT
ncbi:MAG: hydrogenase formation protein HypD [Acidobacteriota bacterium]|nr:hydrogenase formation protein HypD [Acidobacteriota bacterium]